MFHESRSKSKSRSKIKVKIKIEIKVEIKIKLRINNKGGPNGFLLCVPGYASLCRGREARTRSGCSY